LLLSQIDFLQAKRLKICLAARGAHSVPPNPDLREGEGKGMVFKWAGAGQKGRGREVAVSK